MRLSLVAAALAAAMGNAVPAQTGARPPIRSRGGKVSDALTRRKGA